MNYFSGFTRNFFRVYEKVNPPLTINYHNIRFVFFPFFFFCSTLKETFYSFNNLWNLTFIVAESCPLSEAISCDVINVSGRSLDVIKNYFLPSFLSSIYCLKIGHLSRLSIPLGWKKYLFPFCGSYLNPSLVTFF